MATSVQDDNPLSQLGGLTDVEGAKYIAKKLLNTYNKSGSNSELTSHDISPMMVDAYACMQKSFNPNKSDVDTYFKILDRNSDGKVSLNDLEQLAIKYLVGDIQFNNSSSSSSQVKPQQKQQEQQVALPEQNNSISSRNEPGKQVQITQSQRFQQQTSNQQNTITTSTVVTKTITKTEVQTKKPLDDKMTAQLAIARKLFKRFDTDSTGYITEEEVGPLLTATYKHMGVHYVPTEKDIADWIKMTDLDGDGKVSLEEYEYLIANSLKAAGVDNVK